MSKKKDKVTTDEMMEEVETGEETEVNEAEVEEVDVSNKLQTELDDTKNKLLRLQADFDNYRKRNASLQSQTRENATADVLENLLPLIDNFERAEASIVDEGVLSGIRLIKDQFVATLTKYGVVEIDALDKPFDPNFHNAVMQEDNADKKDMVLEVYQKGYMYHDKVMRYSMVKVGK